MGLGDRCWARSLDHETARGCAGLCGAVRGCVVHRLEPSMFSWAAAPSYVTQHHLRGAAPPRHPPLFCGTPPLLARHTVRITGHGSAASTSGMAAQAALPVLWAQRFSLRHGPWVLPLTHLVVELLHPRPYAWLAATAIETVVGAVGAAAIEEAVRAPGRLGAQRAGFATASWRAAQWDRGSRSVRQRAMPVPAAERPSRSLDACAA